MIIRLHIVSCHPFVSSFLERMLSLDPAIKKRFLVSSIEDPVHDEDPRKNHSRLFVLDTCALPREVHELCRTFRVRFPGSRFVALLRPEASTNEEMLRLLYAGVDGMVSFTCRLEEELPRAIDAIVLGNLWIPHQVMQEYVLQTRLLLESHLCPDRPLTGREEQILQLMVRRFSNREIGVALKISERTVKFHISNVFTKTSIQNRSELLAAIARPCNQGSLSCQPILRPEKRTPLC